MTNSSGVCCNRSASGCAGCTDAGTDRRMKSDCGGHCHHCGDSARPDNQIKQTPVGKLSGFVGFLRAQGLSVGIGETEDALRALNMVGFEDRETVKAVLRTLFAGSKAEQAVFDRCFDLYFVSEAAFQANQAAMAQAQQELEARRRELEERLSVQGKSIDIRDDLKDVYARMPQSERDRLKDVMDDLSERMKHAPKLYEGFIRSVFMKSLLEQQMLLEDAAEGAAQADSDADLMFRNISGFRDADLPRAHALIDQVTRRINGEIVARRRRTGRSMALDFRRTIRAGLSTGGALCRLRHKPRHSHRKHIVMLCDVSASMLQFSEFALRFIKSLSEVSDHSEIFLFSEQTQRVSPFALQNMDLFGDYVRSSGVWGRGTNVGRALDAVLSAAPPVLTPNTVLLVLSDAKTVGLDRAEVSLIRASKAAGSVIWMNPIPEAKWQYLKGPARLRRHCSMVPCGTLEELARACQRLISG